MDSDEDSNATDLFSPSSGDESSGGSPPMNQNGHSEKHMESGESTQQKGSQPKEGQTKGKRSVQTKLTLTKLPKAQPYVPPVPQKEELSYFLPPPVSYASDSGANSSATGNNGVNDNDNETSFAQATPIQQQQHQEGQQQQATPLHTTPLFQSLTSSIAVDHFITSKSSLYFYGSKITKSSKGNVGRFLNERLGFIHPVSGVFIRPVITAMMEQIRNTILCQFGPIIGNELWAIITAIAIPPDDTCELYHTPSPLDIPLSHGILEDLAPEHFRFDSVVKASGLENLVSHMAASTGSDHIIDSQHSKLSQSSQLSQDCDGIDGHGGSEALAGQRGFPHACSASHELKSPTNIDHQLAVAQYITEYAQAITSHFLTSSFPELQQQLPHGTAEYFDPTFDLQHTIPSNLDHLKPYVFMITYILNILTNGPSHSQPQVKNDAISASCLFSFLPEYDQLDSTVLAQRTKEYRNLGLQQAYNGQMSVDMYYDLYINPDTGEVAMAIDPLDTPIGGSSDAAAAAAAAGGGGGGGNDTALQGDEPHSRSHTDQSSSQDVDAALNTDERGDININSSPHDHMDDDERLAHQLNLEINGAGGNTAAASSVSNNTSHISTAVPISCYVRAISTYGYYVLLEPTDPSLLSASIRSLFPRWICIHPQGTLGAYYEANQQFAWRLSLLFSTLFQHTPVHQLSASYAPQEGRQPHHQSPQRQHQTEASADTNGSTIHPPAIHTSLPCSPTMPFVQNTASYFLPMTMFKATVSWLFGSLLRAQQLPYQYPPPLVGQQLLSLQVEAQYQHSPHLSPFLPFTDNQLAYLHSVETEYSRLEGIYKSIVAPHHYLPSSNIPHYYGVHAYCPSTWRYPVSAAILFQHPLPHFSAAIYHIVDQKTGGNISYTHYTLGFIPQYHTAMSSKENVLSFTSATSQKESGGGLCAQPSSSLTSSATKQTHGNSRDDDDGTTKAGQHTIVFNGNSQHIIDDPIHIQGIINPCHHFHIPIHEVAEFQGVIDSLLPHKLTPLQFLTVLRGKQHDAVVRWVHKKRLEKEQQQQQLQQQQQQQQPQQHSPPQASLQWESIDLSKYQSQVVLPFDIRKCVVISPVKLVESQYASPNSSSHIVQSLLSHSSGMLGTIMLDYLPVHDMTIRPSIPVVYRYTPPFAFTQFHINLPSWLCFMFHVSTWLCRASAEYRDQDKFNVPLDTDTDTTTGIAPLPMDVLCSEELAAADICASHHPERQQQQQQGHQDQQEQHDDNSPFRQLLADLLTSTNLILTSGAIQAPHLVTEKQKKHGGDVHSHGHEHGNSHGNAGSTENQHGNDKSQSTPKLLTPEEFFQAFIAGRSSPSDIFASFFQDIPNIKQIDEFIREYCFQNTHDRFIADFFTSMITSLAPALFPPASISNRSNLSNISSDDKLSHQSRHPSTSSLVYSPVFNYYQPRIPSPDDDNDNQFDRAAGDADDSDTLQLVTQQCSHVTPIATIPRSAYLHTTIPAFPIATVNPLSSVELPVLPHLRIAAGASTAIDERAYIAFLETQHLRVFQEVGDGNCLFRCVSRQVFGTDHFFPIARLIAVSHLFRMQGMYKWFLSTDIEDYIYKLSTDSEWADHIDIKALCDAFGVRTIIYRADSFDQPPTILEPDAFPDDPLEGEDESNLPIDDDRDEESFYADAAFYPTIYLSYHGQNHYNSLYSMTDLDKDECTITTKPILNETQTRRYIDKYLAWLATISPELAATIIKSVPGYPRYHQSLLLLEKISSTIGQAGEEATQAGGMAGMTNSGNGGSDRGALTPIDHHHTPGENEQSSTTVRQPSIQTIYSPQLLEKLRHALMLSQVELDECLDRGDVESLIVSRYLDKLLSWCKSHRDSLQILEERNVAAARHLSQGHTHHCES